MRRREVISLLGGAAVVPSILWPLVARAQQSTAPVIGFLRNTTQEDSVYLVTALRQGLKEAGAAVSPDGYTVGALVAVNAVGQATIGDGPHFWAAPYEIGSEFGGLGWPVPFPSTALALRTKGHAAGNTTIAVVATDAILTKAQARRLAVAAQDGLARAIRPVHTPLDGDTVFAVATGARALVDPVRTLARSVRWRQTC